MTTVLVVDDQQRARDLLGSELSDAGFTVLTATDGEEGWKTFCRGGANVVVTDMSMPRCDGIELLRRIRSRSDVPVIVFSGHGSIESAAEAFKAGADDFVNSLDIEIDDLVSMVRDAANTSHAPPSNTDLEKRLLGESEAIARVRWQLNGLAPLRTPVIVSGEPGTGRSTAIRAMHELGATSSGPLHRIDASAFVPAEFPESPATAGIHLVDVEHLTPQAQQYWKNRLVRDETSGLRSPLRIFASSSAQLPEWIEAGAFDARLGKALLRFEVEMPRLRDRQGDVPLIAKAMLKKLAAAVGRERIQLSPAALKYLESCRLPENLHQLERLLERGVAYSLGKVIRKQTLEELMADLEKTVESMRQERMLHERDKLLDALRQAGGNITKTAQSLEKSRAAVYRLMAKHDIPLARRA
jgi:DNA-binding NtrC family response regulator